ncbi:preprotein translocase subunit SecY [Guptibacillus spartinae]|uniref:preprotein translocase subunit SecY n=1 Tax=Guptibacillus spartinae TaxID=3025679 RepID=UPI00236003E2|nr:preprotein translocase subunit SecY [Pseudalkalibacillus spartinae]
MISQNQSGNLKKKIIFTLSLLFLYRIGSFIPVPGVDSQVLKSSLGNSDLFGFMNTFSGGSLQNFSIFAVGIMPYITASIIIQLLQINLSPALKELSEQGAKGQEKIKNITRIGALGIALIQSIALSLGFNNMFPGLIPDPSLGTYALIAVTLTVGTGILLVMGELITNKGLGNGISVIIFSGILAGFPNALQQFYSLEFQNLSDGTFYPIAKLIIIALVVVLMTLVIIYIQESYRRIPIHYSKRSTVDIFSTAEATFIPIKINTAGVIPVIFAVAIMMAPVTIARFFPQNTIAIWVTNNLNYTQPIGMTIYSILIMAFAYFYAFVQVNPKKMADDMQKNSGYVPGVRPGEKTKIYITHVLKHITFVGALFLTAVSILPLIITLLSSMPQQLMIGGPTLIIVVGVALDISKHIKQHKVKRGYKGFMNF